MPFYRQHSFESKTKKQKLQRVIIVAPAEILQMGGWNLKTIGL
jgi:hypothetical protein